MSANQNAKVSWDYLESALYDAWSKVFYGRHKMFPDFMSELRARHCDLVMPNESSISRDEFQALLECRSLLAILVYPDNENRPVHRFDLEISNALEAVTKAFSGPGVSVLEEVKAKAIYIRDNTQDPETSWAVGCILTILGEEVRS